MKKILLFVFVLLALIGVGIWYLLSPKNLGVAYSRENLDAAHAKLGVTFETLPQSTGGKTLIFSGSHRVDQSFSSAELTAMVGNRHTQNPAFPFKNVQIRVNPDGTVEGSATLGFADAVDYLLSLGVSSADIEEGAKKFNVPNTTLPVYLRVAGSVIANDSKISVASAKIVGISVPDNLVAQYTPALNSLVEMVLKDRKPSHNIEKLVVENGMVHFVGTAPDRESAVQKF